MGTRQKGMNLAVCLVEHHPLAMKFLRNLLSSCIKGEIFSFKKGVNKDSPRKKTNGQLVWVIDRGTFDKPFESYLRRLSDHSTEDKTLILDDELSDDELCSLLNQGIDGFVSYAQVNRSLPEAILAVAEGHVWVAPCILERYVSYVQQLSHRKRKSPDKLSPREADVLRLLRKKLSNKEISSALTISESTVKFHLVRIFQKLGVHSRYAIVESDKP